MTFILIGFLLLFIAAAIVVFTNPSVLGMVGKKMQAAEDAVTEAKREFSETRESDAEDLSMSTRLKSVRAGWFLKLYRDSRYEDVQIKDVIRFTELIEAGGNWSTTSNTSVGLLLEEGLYLLYLHTTDTWYLLDTERINQNDAELLAKYGKAFGASDQRGDIQFDYGGKTWKVQDIGRFKVQADKGSHIPTGMDMRFMQAESEGTMLYVEDTRSGADFASIGQEVDIDELVMEIIGA